MSITTIPVKRRTNRPALRRLVEAAADALPRHAAADRVPGDRRADDDHALLPLLRGGRRHAR